jgi:hypothetical protein
MPVWLVILLQALPALLCTIFPVKAVFEITLLTTPQAILVGIAATHLMREGISGRRRETPGLAALTKGG